MSTSSAMIEKIKECMVPGQPIKFSTLKNQPNLSTYHHTTINQAVCSLIDQGWIEFEGKFITQATLKLRKERLIVPQDRVTRKKTKKVATTGAHPPTAMLKRSEPTWDIIGGAYTRAQLQELCEAIMKVL